jgi:sigma-B regulation protein RsbU (phosphoserine phosphatase)
MATPHDDPLAKLRHDLRTPLNQIIGYGEMLLEDARDEALRGDLQRILGAAGHLLEQVNTRLVAGGVADQAFHSAGKAESALAAVDDEPAAPARFGGARLLVVDDKESNRDLLARRLLKDGYAVDTAIDGVDALEKLESAEYDLVLLDIMMPRLDGHGVLLELKSSERLRHTPVIMVSALDELSSVVRCIAAGAEDYLPKPFNPTLLRARVGACLEKKALRDQERRTYAALVESQAALAAELREAAAYVESLLPPRAGDERVVIDWIYKPSTSLGGDAFGYHWLDERHLAVYLLDVCGHGVGAALLSTSAMNVIRSQTLPDTDFHSPGSVLAALNRAFQMESQNEMYFTIWYGVYDAVDRAIRYASGGHHAALLLLADGSQRLLEAQGPIIGLLPETSYHAESSAVPAGAKLHIFSDGVYEVRLQDGHVMDYDQFAGVVAGVAGRGGRPGDIHMAMQRVQGREEFEDDFSLLQLSFGASDAQS